MTEMSNRRTIKRIAILGAIPALAGLALAAPAMAAAGPAASGNAGSIQGTVSIPESLTFAYTMTDFTLNPSITVANHAAMGGGSFGLESNDPAGAYVEEVGPAYLAGTGSNKYQFPTNDISSDTDTMANPSGGTYVPVPTPSQTPLVVVTDPGVTGGTDSVSYGSGWDSFSFGGWALNTVPNAPADSYTGAILLSAFSS